MFELRWRLVNDVVEKFKDRHRPGLDDGLIRCRLTVAAEDCVECSVVWRGDWIPEGIVINFKFYHLYVVTLVINFTHPKPEF